MINKHKEIFVILLSLRLLVCTKEKMEHTIITKFLIFMINPL